MSARRKFSFLEKYGLPLWMLPCFILVVVLFAFCTEWDPEFAEDKITKVGDDWVRTPLGNTFGNQINAYGMHTDAVAMCVLGFGFLYVFSKYYVWGGVGFNFFICGFCFLWTNVCRCFVSSMWAGEFHKTQLNLESLVICSYVTAAVLISFGAFYGFASPAQLLLVCFLEPFFNLINAHILEKNFQIADAGGSLLCHTFGAFFGIGIVQGMGVRPRHIPDKHRTTTYFSDMGAMIGSIVLWMYWPSFNGALLYNDVTLQGRVVMNTYLAIAASCVTAFATSTVVHKGKLNMLEIQNATLAGGVIIGMISSFQIQPWTAVLIGGIGGMISSMGYGLYHPFLERCNIVDSAGVQMLHGVPGILGAVFAALACLADNHNYMYSFLTQWNTSSISTRSKGEQFGFVVAGIVVTLAVSLISGFLSGLITRLPICPKVAHPDIMVDHDFWEIEDENHDPRGRKNADNSTVLANKSGKV